MIALTCFEAKICRIKAAIDERFAPDRPSESLSPTPPAVLAGSHVPTRTSPATGRQTFSELSSVDVGGSDHSFLKVAATGIFLTLKRRW
jgi:hypothetical protein